MFLVVDSSRTGVLTLCLVVLVVELVVLGVLVVVVLLLVDEAVLLVGLVVGLVVVLLVLVVVVVEVRLVVMGGNGTSYVRQRKRRLVCDSTPEEASAVHVITTGLQSTEQLVLGKKCAKKNKQILFW